MQNLLENELKQLLEQDPEQRFVVEGRLNKNKIVEATLSLDENLLSLLTENDRIKNHFFQNVNGMLVFDKVAFQKFVSNKRFLPDSYTAFKNKIGLTVEGEYLTESKEVVLSWPYKDCVLEGGQTKEDQKRNEIFWNTTLAPDEVDRLLSPKVLTNFKKYDREGEHEVSEITEEDNLILKGNNLLALYSLKQRYEGKVKLIYIDPPYNTGNDDFGYNDRFNHSAWYTFMKNRLEVARELLTDDGSIWINIDDDEGHYLKVLSDEIFGRDNFVANILWQKRTSPDARAILGDAHDHILLYSKKHNLFKEALNYLPLTKEQKAEYKNPDNDPRGPWVSSDFTAQGYRPNQMYEIVTPSGRKYSPPPGRCWKNVENEFKKQHQEGRMWYGVKGDAMPRRKTYLFESVGRVPWTWWSNIEVGHNQEAKKESIAIFGENDPFPTPKPEKLLQRIIHIGSNKGDLILDFFTGSGTTAAVAKKMNRKFIAVEQMDYVNSVTTQRIKKVIEGEQGGISEDVNWQGGGSFIFAELKRSNALFSDKIEAAKDTQTLWKIWEDMKHSRYISHKVDPKEINEQKTEFEELSLEEQKRLLIALLDKNHLYVNYSEVEDETWQVSEVDKKLNRLFYKNS